MSYSDDLERAYRIVDWMESPWGPSGREKYLRALREFESLVDHPWLANLIGLF